MKRLVLLVCVLCLIVSGVASAVVNTFTGAVSNDIDNPLNWSTGVTWRTYTSDENQITGAVTATLSNPPGHMIFPTPAGITMRIDKGATLTVPLRLSPQTGNTLIIGDGTPGDTTLVTAAGDDNYFDGGITYMNSGLLTCPHLFRLSSTALFTVNGGKVYNGVDATVRNSASVIINGGIYKTGDRWILQNTATTTINNGGRLEAGRIFLQGLSGSVMNLNNGSTTTTTGDFQLTGAGGALTVQSGAIITSTGGSFGTTASAAGGTLNINGGTLNLFQMIALGGRWNIGGNAVINANNFLSTPAGVVLNIDPLWTGSWTFSNISALDYWRNQLTNGLWQLGGTVITSTIFEKEFLVSGDGKTMSLVPEPATLLLLGTGCLMAFKRKK